MRRASVLVALAAFALLSGPAPAAAQDASPPASPAAACVAPPLPPGTPTPMEASPEPAPPEEGTPAADDASTPEPPTEATPLPGTPADAATTDEVIAAYNNVVACENAGDYEAMAALFTPRFLEDAFGITNPYDLRMVLEGSPPLEPVSLENVQTHPDGRVSVEDTYISGGHQLQRDRTYFVRQGEFLLIDQAQSLPVAPPSGADVATIEVALTDFAFELSPSSVANAEYVVLDGTNTGQYFHEILVVRFPEGTDVTALDFAGPPPEGTEFIGGNAGPPGAEIDVVLTRLEPGTYTVLCFVDEPDGVPHVEKGMVAQFTIEDGAGATPAA